jgi:hypothetical protein
VSEKKKVAEKESKPLPASLGGEELLVDPDAKANFWKPKHDGETRVGKLLGKTNTQYGEVLNLDTSEGPCIIPISVTLKKVDWDKVVGRTLLFQYKGTEKRYRKYLVKAMAK